MTFEPVYGFSRNLALEAIVPYTHRILVIKHLEKLFVLKHYTVQAYEGVEVKVNNSSCYLLDTVPCGHHDCKGKSDSEN